MQTVIGCIGKGNAGQLFSSPEFSGDKFREIVDIYACGDNMWLANILPGYVKKLKGERDGADCLVVARSFVPGRGPGGNPGRGHGGRHDHGCPPPPPEMFDIVYCVPLEAITEDMIVNFEEIWMAGGGRHRH